MEVFAGLNNDQINPVGVLDFGLVREFEVQGQRLTVTNGQLELVNEDRVALLNWIYNEYGRFINYPISIVSLGFNQRYFMDLKTAKITDSSITADLIVRRGNDNFYERSRGLTFEEVFKKGFIPSDLINYLPYQVVRETTALEKVMLLATLLTVSQTLFTIIQQTAYLVAEGANLLNVLVLILKAVLIAVWLIATLALLATILKEIKSIILPKVRYFQMCSDYDLIKAGCDYLGFTLQSTYLKSKQSKYFTVPVPKAKPNKSIFDFLQDELDQVYHNQAYPSSLDGSIATHWGLIEDWLKLHNLEIFVSDGVVQIEQPSFFNSTTNLTLPVAFSDQQKSEKSYVFNSELLDVWRRKYLSYQIDYVDTHSPDIDGSMRVEVITEPITIPPNCNDLVAHTGLYEVQSAHALMKRKDKLLPAEKALLVLAKKADQILNLFGNGSDLASGISARDGIGMIGSQWFSIPKRVYVDKATGKQPKDYLAKLSMDVLYQQNHASFDVKTRNARRFEMTIPMTPNNFQVLQSNNRFYTEDGELARVMSCKFYDSEQQRKAEMIIQLSDNSAFNTKVTKLA